jgi:hypothetical protein
VGFALAVGVVAVLGIAAGWVARGVMRAPAPPSSRSTRPPQFSIHADREVVRYPLPKCSRCGKKIKIVLDGDECWLRSDGRKFYRYHLACADEHGEPLPPGW